MHEFSGPWGRLFAVVFILVAGALVAKLLTALLPASPVTP